MLLASPSTAFEGAFTDPRAWSEPFLGALPAGYGVVSDVFLESRQSRFVSVDYAGNAASLSDFDEGLAVRVMTKTGVRLASTSDVRAAAARRLLSDTEFGVGVRVKNSPDPRVSSVIGGGRAIALAAVDAVSLVREARDRALGYGSDVRKAAASLASVRRRYVVVSAAGIARVEQTQSLLTLRARVRTDAGAKEASASTAEASASVASHDDLAARVVSAARASGRRTQGLQGRMPVVLGPGGGAVFFHEAFGHSLEADVVRRIRRLPLIKCSTEASDFHLVDDASVAGAPGSFGCDDEGVPAGRTDLIVGGEVVGLLTDRWSGSEGKEPRLGSARRQTFRHMPLPRMSNTLVANGTISPEALVGDVDQGLYCGAFGGGRLEEQSGSFSFTANDCHVISGGRLVDPVGPCRLVGSVADGGVTVLGVGDDFMMLDGGTLCGKRGQSVHVGLGQPTVLVKGLNVAPE